MNSECEEIIAAIRALKRKDDEEKPPAGELAQRFIERCIEDDT